jgi:hypothetical protein
MGTKWRPNMTGWELLLWWGRTGHLPPGVTEPERAAFLLEIEALRREQMPRVNMREAQLMRDQEIAAEAKVAAGRKAG